MASLIVAGNTSGTVTLQAPDVSGSTVLTLPTTSGTIVTTGGGASVPFAAGSAASPSITFTGDTNTGIFSPGADIIGFAEGGTEVMRINSSGNLIVGATAGFAANPRTHFQSASGQITSDFFRDNSIVSDVEVFRVIANDGGGTVVASARTSGVIAARGIQFPGTQSPSGDVNTLDDYEEGTFTPAFGGSSTNPTVSYSGRGGSYTKIGNRVFFELLMIVSSVSSQGTGNITITGLPFAEGGGNYEFVCTLGYNDVFFTAFKTGFVIGASITIIPVGITQGNVSYGSPANDATSNLRAGYLAISGFYLV
jgi:hypothetical protein